MAHLSFIKSCLGKNIVPKGLRIRTIPVVPQVKCLEHMLHKKWETTLNRASHILLKHLREYHKEAISILTRKINRMEAWLRTDANFSTELDRILSNTRRRAKVDEESKRKKVSKLLGNKTKKERHRRPRSESNRKRENTNSMATNNTVVNVSNVNLSEGENQLLSRGLSFCPRPSRIDQFQLKEDIKSFTRRLRLREFFYDQDEDNSTPIPPFRKKS